MQCAGSWTGAYQLPTLALVGVLVLVCVCEIPEKLAAAFFRVCEETGFHARLDGTDHRESAFKHEIVRACREELASARGSKTNTSTVGMIRPFVSTIRS